MILNFQKLKSPEISNITSFEGSDHISGHLISYINLME